MTAEQPNPADIKTFWNNQAQDHGGHGSATSPDLFYRDYEISCIIEQLSDKDTSVVDIGCGNGYSTLAFAKARPKTIFVGLDYSEPMIEEAKKARDASDLRNVMFEVADIRNGIPTKYRPTTVISERCLINLSSWEEQKQALGDLWAALRTGGKLILVENTSDGLEMLNGIRGGFGLHEIQQRWHNCYFNHSYLDRFLINELEPEYMQEENIGNLYYLISRVVYPALAAINGEEIRYDHPINAIAAKLPPVDGPYSPNMMWILEK